ncbi:DUF222 domain-containing protein [Geodermatophilus ruber]|uniref:DUF222 domain-containing protein n=1 Tax=Geodermatophilus ruber TaxID=504800 RepID=UPI001FE023A4|nr:DUF222 domain-containing protein [Geodermatophilus ruber]
MPAAASRLPVALLSREQKAAELARLQAEKAMRAAYEAELILALADDTPALPDDHPAARKGSWAADGELPGVAESFTHELSMVLTCGRGTASHAARRAWTYRENLPATWAALAAGTLDEARARALAEVLVHARPEVARGIEAQLLPRAGDLSIGTLRKLALQLLLERDAAAVGQRRRSAQRQADVRTYPSPLDGMSTLAAELPTPAAACYEVVDRLAQMLKADGDPRPIGQLRAQALADLLRRLWDDSRPAVTARLTIVATLAGLARRSSQAGEVNGPPITAAHLRELLDDLQALAPGGLQSPPGGAAVLALTDTGGALLATATLDQLARLARRGCPTHPAGDCSCPLLGRGRAPRPTRPPVRSTPSSPPATAPAGSSTAASASAGPTSTTSSRTPTAARPTAATCAACTAATTGSRPGTRPGASS